MNLKEVVGINLKYYRYQSGLSQEKFYTNLELNPKYMACIERGEENITIDHIDEIAEKLGISTHELITYNEEHVINKKRIDEKVKVNS